MVWPRAYAKFFNSTSFFAINVRSRSLILILLSSTVYDVSLVTGYTFSITDD